MHMASLDQIQRVRSNEPYLGRMYHEVNDFKVLKVPLFPLPQVSFTRGIGELVAGPGFTLDPATTADPPM